MLIENGILKAYDGDMKNVVIPEGVRVIAGCLEMDEMKLPFRSRKEIETVTMSDSVTEIGAKAFEYCENLRSIQFSKNLQKIHVNAFLGCKNLRSLTLPASLTCIEWGGLSSIEIDEFIYEGTIWQLEKVDITDVNIKKIICKDCTINFEQKPFYIEEVAYDGTVAQLQENYKDNWILRRTRIIHCKDGTFSSNIRLRNNLLCHL